MPTEFVLPNSIVPVYRGMTPLQSSGAVLRLGPDEAPRRATLVLTTTVCDVTYLHVRGGKAEQVTRRIERYDLAARDRDASDLYSWSVWWHDSPPYPQVFWLATVRGGRTYLALSNTAGLWLADVTCPRNTTVAFHEDLGHWPTPALHQVPVGLFPEVGANNWGFASFREAGRGIVEFVSLEEGPAGELVLTIKDPTGEDRAVMARRDGQWRRVRYESASGAEPER
jgi:hypothetical protein